MDDLTRIIGQNRAIEFLRTCIDNQHLSHAYLFCGPAGVGKMTTAVAFANTLLKREDPKGRVLLANRAHPDLFTIERIPDKTRLSKEQIKEMQSWLALKPYRAQHRLVIIRDAHLLTPEAGNALLKILEEPPEYAILILVTDEAAIMETILSRCQPVRFKAVSEDDIITVLTGRGIDIEQASCAARLCQGSIAAALEFAQEEDLARQWNLARQHFVALARGDMAAVFEAADTIEKDPHLLSYMLSTILRDVCVYRSSGNPALLMFSEHQELIKSLPDADPDRIGAAVNRVQDLQKHMRYHVNPLALGINIAYAVRGAFWD